ncbi:MAG: DUF2341 domain-containing protein, partial [Desulfobacteraceae bacterium]
GTAETNNDDYIIGNRGAGDRTFDGTIDELRIYDRILSTDEISDRYLGKRELSRDGLVIEYLMDAGSGNTVSDSSGNGYDGDMTGHAAAWVRSRAHDSTDNGNSGKRSESMAAPVEHINGCDPFDSDGVGIIDPGGSWEFADGGLDAGTSDFTISAWFYRASAMTENYPTIVYKGAGGSTEGYWFDYVKDDDAINLNIDDGINPRFIAHSNSSIGVTADEWHYVTVVLDREPALDTAYFYLNGDPVGSESSGSAAGNSISSDIDVWIGTNSFIGNLDEVRISSGLRSSEWIQTEFNNQNDPSDFYELGNGSTCSYDYKRALTIDGDQVGGSSGYLDDFPVLVKLEGDWLKNTPDGDIQHPSGWDIIFKAEDSTTCEGPSPCTLAHEIEEYTPSMDIKVATGTFTTPASTGTDSITGIGFQPKAIYLWGTAVTDENVAVHSAQWIGFADDATPTRNQKVVAVTGENGVSVADTYRSAVEDANAVLYILNADGDGGSPPADPIAVATISSYDSDGFTLDYSTTSSGYIVHYVAYGGDDLQAFVGQSAANASPVSDVPFRPELVFVTTSCNSIGQTNAYGTQSFGVFNDDLNQWWVGSDQGYNDATEQYKDSVLRTDAFIGQIYEGARTWSISVTSITDTGFAWSGSNTDAFYYLALNLSGLDTYVGNFTKETTGADPVSQDLPDFGFTPGFYMLASGSEINETPTTPNSSRVTLGAFDGTTQHSTTRTDEKGPSSNQNADQRSSSSAVLGISDLDAAFDALATAQAITDSTPSIQWSPNDTNPYIIGVVGIEEPPEARLVAWVKVPKLYAGNNDPGNDTVIYMYYGNECVDEDPQNAAGVWTNGYAGVWHLSENQSGTGNPDVYKDSTFSANHLDDNVLDGNKDGKANGGQRFDGATDIADIADPGGAWDFADGGLDAGTGDFAVSAWVRYSSDLTESFPTILSKGGGADTNAGYWFNYQPYDETIDLRVSDGTSRFIANSNGSLGVAADEWHHFYAVFDRSVGSDTAYFYLDGNPVGSESSDLIDGNSASGDDDFTIGLRDGGNRPWMGNLDEVRISSGLRTSEWIETEYNNQSSPSTFFGLGGENNSAPTAPTTPYCNDSTAQSGLTNPSGITDPTPAFSAIYNDPNSGDIANKYRVEVNTASDFGGTVMWDSGANGTSMADTTAGNRCPDIIYAGTTLASDTTYYWRITFWDDDPTQGTASAIQNFTTGTISTTTQSLGENSSRDDFTGVTEDTFMDSGSNDQEEGSCTGNDAVRIGYRTDAGTRAMRSLIKFDLTDIDPLIAASSDIISATLWVKIGQKNGNDIDVDAFRVLKSWSQGDECHNVAESGETTWRYQSYNGTEWTSWGADSAGTDRASSADDTTTITATGWFSWDVTQSVKDMHDDGNYEGWVLKSQSESGTNWSAFYSSEHGTEADRPYLEIIYYADPTCGYAYKRAITIDHTKVIGESGDTVDLTDFPVVIKETGVWLRNSAYNHGLIENTNGYDIIFKDATETITLAHEIEYYNAGSEAAEGELVAWVKVPTLDADDDTVIYMYYGNSCIQKNTENPETVWDSNYMAVWHLSEDPTDSSPAFKDSTSNNNDGTDYGIMTSSDQVPGAIDGSLDFDGGDDYLDADDSSSLRISGSFTVSAWIN